MLILALVSVLAAIAGRATWRLWRMLPRRNADFDLF